MFSFLRDKPGNYTGNEAGDENGGKLVKGIRWSSINSGGFLKRGIYSVVRELLLVEQCRVNTSIIECSADNHRKFLLDDQLIEKCNS